MSLKGFLRDVWFQWRKGGLILWCKLTMWLTLHTTTLKLKLVISVPLASPNEILCRIMGNFHCLHCRIIVVFHQEFRYPTQVLFFFKLGLMLQQKPLINSLVAHSRSVFYRHVYKLLFKNLFPYGKKWMGVLLPEAGCFTQEILKCVWCKHSKLHKIPNERKKVS